MLSRWAVSSSGTSSRASRYRVRRFVFGPAATSLVRGDEEIFERPRGVTGLAPVRSERGRGCAAGPMSTLEEFGHGRVALPARRPRHGGIGHLSNQHVLEGELLLALDPRETRA